MNIENGWKFDSIYLWNPLVDTVEIEHECEQYKSIIDFCNY